MQLKLDVKTLIIGIGVGIIVTVALGIGAGSASATRFGIALEEKGTALVQTSSGNLYIIDSEAAMATRVLVHTNISSKPGESRYGRGRPLKVTDAVRTKKTDKNY
jgi:hypothetical protein